LEALALPSAHTHQACARVWVSWLELQRREEHLFRIQVSQQKYLRAFGPISDLEELSSLIDLAPELFLNEAKVFIFRTSHFDF
jgi:hypothetical protein